MLVPSLFHDADETVAVSSRPGYPGPTGPRQAKVARYSPPDEDSVKSPLPLDTPWGVDE